MKDVFSFLKDIFKRLKEVCLDKSLKYIKNADFYYPSH